MAACQRFTRITEHSLGNIFNCPTLTELFQSSDALRQVKRRERIEALRGGCNFYTICEDGCPSNAATVKRDIDPFCEAYKRIYKFAQDRLSEEIASSENILEVMDNPIVKEVNPSLRKSRYISLAYGSCPTEIKGACRQIKTGVRKTLRTPISFR